MRPQEQRYSNSSHNEVMMRQSAAVKERWTCLIWRTLRTSAWMSSSGLRSFLVAAPEGKGFSDRKTPLVSQANITCAGRHQFLIFILSPPPLPPLSAHWRKPSIESENFLTLRLSAARDNSRHVGFGRVHHPFSYRSSR